MKSFTVICAYCGTLVELPGATQGPIVLWACSVCDCRFETVAKTLTDEQDIYVTKMIREGVLNKRKT